MDHIQDPQLMAMRARLGLRPDEVAEGIPVPAAAATPPDLGCPRCRWSNLGCRGCRAARVAGLEVGSLLPSTHE